MAHHNAAGTGTIRKKTVRRGKKEYTYWEGRYTVGFDPGTGKQVQRSITAKTQREVVQKLRQATMDVGQGKISAPSKTTLGEWLDIWVKEYLGNIKPHTQKSYMGIIKNHIKPAIGSVKLTSLTPVQVQQLINRIRSTKGTSVGSAVNPKTIKNIHGVLHSALNQAVQCGYLSSNPADGTILPRRTRAEIHVLEDDQIIRFLRAIEGHRFQNVYLLDLFTGLRQSELLGLQWPDVDFKRKIITVKRQLQYPGHSHGGYQYAIPKSNKPRMVALPDKAIEALENQKARQAIMAHEAGSSWNNPDNLVFTDELGNHIKHDVIYRNLKKIFGEMGCPRTALS